MTEGQVRRMLELRARADRALYEFHRKHGATIQQAADQMAREFSKVEPEVLRASLYIGTAAAVSLIDGVTSGK